MLTNNFTNYISDNFLEVSKLYPDATAVSEKNGSITYAELGRISYQIGSCLSAMCNNNKVVAIYGMRSARLIATMLGCARFGLTFAVLDSAYPAQRINQMISIIHPDVVVGVDTKKEELEKIINDSNYQRIVFNKDSLNQNIVIDEAKPLISETNTTAYLLFTSGTTGLPKCIKTSHKPLIHFVNWYIETFNVKPRDRFSMLSGLSHDPILRDIFVPLSCGGEIVIPEQSIIVNPAKLFDWFKQNNINYAHATPQLLKILCTGASHTAKLVHLKYVFSGGDALRISLVNQLNDISNNCQVVNFYGTSETPQAMAYYVASDAVDREFIPIGKPISDVNIHILDEKLNAVKKGETGQIAIETEYLSEGYLNDDSMTKDKYIYLDDKNTKAYLTGDCGFIREDGVILLNERMDDQVKIRGFRVELGDIVAAIESLNIVKNIVVLPKPLESGEKILIAYLADSEMFTNSDLEKEGCVVSIKEHLSKVLPQYMLPSQYIWLGSLPLLPNGKLDRQALKNLSTQNETSPDSSINQIKLDENTKLIVEGFEKALGFKIQNVNSSFLDLGGDSLSFIQAALSIEKILGWLPENWEHLPILEIAKRENINTNHFFSLTSTNIVIRALSIILVVLNHIAGYPLIGTTALFVISGISFAKFQMSQLIHKNQISHIYHSLLWIALPAIAITGLRQIVEKDFNLVNLLFIGTLFPPEVHGGKNYWFLDFYLQFFMLLPLFLSIPYIKQSMKSNAYITCTYCMVACMGLATLQAQFHILDIYITGIMPIKYFWLFFMGMGMAHIESMRQKLVMTTLITTYVIFTYQFYYISLYEPFFDSLVLVCFLLLIFVQKIYIPKVSRSTITALASSSLFIYLINIPAHKKISMLDLDKNMIFVELVVILFLGYISMRFWNYFKSRYNQSVDLNH